MPVVSAVRGSMKVTYKCLLWRLCQQLKLKVFGVLGAAYPSAGAYQKISTNTKHQNGLNMNALKARELHF